MRTGGRAIALVVASAALVAGSWWGASSAFGKSHTPIRSVTFREEHIRGVSGDVLVEGSGLVVYTYTGDRKGHAGTCTGSCAAVWPAVRGVPVPAKGVGGMFARINGQVTYNGWPLYTYAGEKSGQNHANSHFKWVRPTAYHPYG